jgi:hypothetical protein
LWLVLAALGCWPSSEARAQEWGGAVAGGGEFNFAPAPTGHGWGLFDVLGSGVVGNGNLRLHYNTTKLHVGIERLSFAKNKMAFFAFAEAEAILSQLLRDYFKRGQRIREFGFNASYALLNAKLQWYPGTYQTLEVVLRGRYWWFATNGRTAPTVVLPPDTWVFEPRIGYVFWKIDAAAREWEAHRLFPRVRGVALGLSGGVDVRSRVQPWGVGDGRNDPRRAIYTVRQWLRAGWQLVPRMRLQLDQWGSYGWFEDDITRNRVGGVNPYVVPIPGLPWTGLISERLFSAQLGVHIKATDASRHEFGVLLGGGAFNDVTRDGAIDTYGGAGGVSLFGDLRFGERDRFQLHARCSWGFPVVWLLDGPYLAGLLSFGARVF